MITLYKLCSFDKKIFLDKIYGTNIKENIDEINIKISNILINCESGVI